MTISPELQVLLDEVNTKGRSEISPLTFGTLEESIRYGRWEDSVLKALAERLIYLLSLDTKQSDAAKFIFNVLSEALGSDNDIEDLSFEPLLKQLNDETEPAFIAKVLRLLALTGDKKYRPIAQRYFNHPHATIQKYAQEAYEDMCYDLPLPKLPESPDKNAEEDQI